MKKILALLFVFGVFSGCKGKKSVAENMKKSTSELVKDCPADAKCIREVFKDSALSIETDVTGKPYYTIQPKVGTTVYRYEMSENQDQQYVDGGYREEIIFELPSDFKNGVLTSEQLAKTKALFGVFCYCKGKAGYYFIKEGTITKTATGVQIEISSVVEGQKVFDVKF
jgi:hypothetical protein